jgi:hypothetical protein
MRPPVEQRVREARCVGMRSAWVCQNVCVALWWGGEGDGRVGGGGGGEGRGSRKGVLYEFLPDHPAH